MCLTIPVKIISIKKNKAIAVYPEQGRGNSGKKIEINLDLVKDIKRGDYGIISNGFLLKKISANEAEEIFNIIRR